MSIYSGNSKNQQAHEKIPHNDVHICIYHNKQAIPSNLMIRLPDWFAPRKDVK